jgi:hypothetical protein
VSHGVDHRGNAHGYNHVLVAVRGTERRRKILLDIMRAPNGDEAAEVVDAMRALRAELPDADLAVVYDGAIRGVHHAALRCELGLFSLNKARGADGRWYKTQLGTEAGGSSTRGTITFTAPTGERCVKQVERLAGQLFVLAPDLLGVLRRERIIDHLRVDRVAVPGGYRWDVEIEVWCPQHQCAHTRIIDAHADPDHPATGPTALEERHRWAEQFRPLPQHRDEFWPVYGRRNAAESLVEYLKHAVMRRGRAGSLAAHHHELDLFLAAFATNALAWAEHGTDRYRTLKGRHQRHHTVDENDVAA